MTVSDPHNNIGFVLNITGPVPNMPRTVMTITGYVPNMAGFARIKYLF